MRAPLKHAGQFLRFGDVERRITASARERGTGAGLPRKASILTMSLQTCHGRSVVAG